MTLPESRAGVLALLVLLLPGISFAYARGRVAGLTHADRDYASRILEAVFAGIIFSALYGVMFGDRALYVLLLRDPIETGSVRLAALTVLVLGIAVPTLTAYVVYSKLQWQRPYTRGEGWRFPLAALSPICRTPTAWDYRAKLGTASWVRVRRSDGHWVAGWYGLKSFSSTYPDPPDLFLERQANVDRTGVIGDYVEGTDGVWLRVGDGDVVEFVCAPDSQQGNGNS